MITLTKTQAAVVEKLRHGWQFRYQPLRGSSIRHYYISSGDGRHEAVAMQTGNALVDKGAVLKDEQQANRISGPWTYRLAEELR